MDARRLFQDLGTEQIIEVSYLVGRYLTHSIDDATFRRMFRADAPANLSADSYNRALDVVRFIEKEEHRRIKEFTRSTRNRYMQEIAAAATEFTAHRSDAATIEDLKDELAGLRF